MLVPTYGVENINPKLTLAEWNLTLPEQTMVWPGASNKTRRISVNSFGFGGANAHVIMDDAYHYLLERGLEGNHSTVITPQAHPQITELADDSSSESGISVTTPPTLGDSQVISQRKKKLFVLSAKDQAGIKRLGDAYSAALGKKENLLDSTYLDNLSYTLSTRRSPLDFRTYLVASSLPELVDKLSRPLPKVKRSSKQDAANLIWVFTGQGAQWPAMGKQLFGFPVFEESVARSKEVLTKLGCPWDVFEEMEKEAGDSNIHKSDYSQTICTVLQVALVDVLRSWGIKPKATVGHSSGEIGAAYAAGYITQADAVKIAYVRGIQSAAVTREGAMMAAGISRKEANEYLSKLPFEAAVVACVNSPNSVTISGNVDAIDELEKTISGDGKFARKLKIKTAYHSPHMREVAGNYLEMIGEIQCIVPENSETVMYSSLTGKIVSDPTELNANYWVNNLTSAVEFSNALTSLLAHTTVPATGGRAVPVRWGGIVEVGPHSALQGPVNQIIAAQSASKTAKEAPYMSVLLRGKDATETALTAAGHLWSLGHGVDLGAVVDVTTPAGQKLKALTNLPAYPWNHTRSFWHEAHLTRSNRLPKYPRTDLLGVPVDLQNTQFEPRWRNHLRITENPWIEDHKITGTTLYPGAGMLIMALEGALQIADTQGKKDLVEGFRYKDVRFERGLVVTAPDDGPAVETSLTLLPHATIPGQFEFRIYSTNNGEQWTKHCYGTIALEFAPSGASEVEESTVNPEWAEQCETYKRLTSLETGVEELDVDDFYDKLETIGMEYGPLFRNTVALSAVPAESAAHGAIIIPDTKSVMPGDGFEYEHVMHPATMDAIFHLLLAGFNDGRPIEEAAVPYAIDDMYVAAKQPQGAGSTFLGYGQLVKKSEGGRELVGDLIVSDDAWSAPKLVVKNFALRQVTSGDDADGAAAGGADDSLNKCARVEWLEDVDFIKTAADVAKIAADETLPVQLSAWLDRLTHKKAVGEVLVVLDGESTVAPVVVKDLLERVGNRPGFSDATLTATSTEGLEILKSVSSAKVHSEVWDAASGAEPPAAAKDAYDVVVLLGDHKTVQVGSEAFALLQKTLAPSGHIVLFSSEVDSIEGFENTLVLSNNDEKLLIASLPASADAVEDKTPAEVYLITPARESAPSSQSYVDLASNLSKALSESNVTVRPVTLSAEIVPSLAGKYVISLLEAERPFIYDWSEQEFDNFKALVSTVEHLFWVTHGGVVQSWNAGVEFAAAQGLLRVLRNEYTLATLPHLDLSSKFDPATVESAKLVADVWRASLVEDAEMEYAELDGAIHVPRAVTDAGFDGDVQLANGTKKPVLSPIDGKNLKPVSGTGPLVWVEDEDAALQLGPSEVEVQVEFATLSGTKTSLSVDTAPTDLGVESVGVVTRVGDVVKSVAVGQRVIVFQTAAVKTHIRADETLVAPVPAGILPQEAAALPRALVAAQYALLDVARLEKDQTVLVHAAASPLGQAAIQTAQRVGAQVLALVSSKEEKEILVEHFGLPASQIFDSALQNFVSAVGKATNGKGVDAVLVTEDSQAVVPSLVTLNDFGYLIDLTGDASLISAASVPANKSNVSIVRIDIDSLAKARPAIAKKLFQKTFQSEESAASLKAIQPTTVFSVGETAEAVDTIRGGQQKGKVVLSFAKDATVLTPPPPAPKLELDPKAAYVIAGGLGALGLDLADMMVERGARDLVFLSRSGGSKNAADLERLESRGVRATAIKCDVTDAASVAAAFGQLRSEGRQVKGVVQCAMVLEDGIFDNMTHAKWNRAFSPKTAGSRNLLAQLWPADKPFFILLSSITGVIGNTAQANYASGNTFEDGLARYARTHLGIPATSIDVGLVSDSSHFTDAGEFGDLEGYLHRYQHGWVGLQTNLGEVRVAVQAVMKGTTADGQTVPAQVVLGLGDRLVRDASTGFQRDRKFELRVVQPEGGNNGASSKSGPSVGEKLSKATNLAEASAAVEDYLKVHVAAAIGVEADEVDVQKPLPEFGVDSLKAVEIRNRALREMQSDVSVFELLSATPLADLATKIAGRSGLVKLAAEETN